VGGHRTLPHHASESRNGSPAEALEQAKDAATRAIELDDSLAEAYSALVSLRPREEICGSIHICNALAS